MSKKLRSEQKAEKCVENGVRGQRLEECEECGRVKESGKMSVSVSREGKKAVGGKGSGRMGERQSGSG